MVIDAHNHLWQYNATKLPWINEDMGALKKDFLPETFGALLQQMGIDGSVAVQVQESDEDNIFLLAQADAFNIIKGVVGWIDMMGNDVEETLIKYSASKKMKGFRYVLQNKEDRALMLQPTFIRNLALFKKYNYTYDILILADQLEYVDTLVKQFPDQLFIIDHLAKPEIRNKHIDVWAQRMKALSQYDNLYCKLSGMVTEANWSNHTYQDFVPYMSTVLETFGTKRVLYGSDWPVCLLASTYQNVFDMVKKFIAGLSANEQQDIMGNNAVTFYKL